MKNGKQLKLSKNVILTKTTSKLDQCEPFQKKSEPFQK